LLWYNCLILIDVMPVRCSITLEDVDLIVAG
jgi:hypothetical protein